MEQHLESTVNSILASAPHSSGVEEVRASATQHMTPESYRDCASKNTVTSHQLPIPPASEPMQYRAIGLIQGTYVPSEEQFTRGMLMTDDDQPVDAVLLGRVMSLVKKHVDLTVPHLWVVYPRTRPKNEHLHAQIVGIWEPDKLHRVLEDNEDDLQDEADADSGDTVTPLTTDPPIATADSDSSELEDLTDADVTDADVTDADVTTGEPLETEQAEGNPPSNHAASVDSADRPELSDSDSVEPAVSQEQNEILQPGVDGDPSLAAESHSSEVETSLSTESDRPSEDAEDAPSTNEDTTEDTTAVAPKLSKPSRPKFSAAAAQAANSPSAPIVEPPQATPVVATASIEMPSSASPSAQPILKDGYFSVRGEVIQFSPEDEQITIRIRQASRKGGGTSANDRAKSDAKEKEFKLHLQGRLDGRVVGYFWDLQVQRQGNDLVVFDSNMIGVVPPRKNKRKKGVGGPRGGRGGVKRRFEGGRPSRSGDRPSPAPRRGGGSKPVLKRNSTSNTGHSSGADE